MKVSVISGSARKGNNTLRAAKAIQNMFPDSTLIDFQSYDLPTFAEGSLVKGEESKFQQRLIAAIDQCDLLFVLTPEYNWFPTSEVINMIHQLANSKYSHIFNNLVVTNVGVSSGRGGRMPAVQLGYVFNKIFNYFNLDSITSPRPFEVQEVTKCIDEEGNLLENSEFNTGFNEFIDYSIKVAKRWHQSS
jgi:chromate reductase